MTSQTLQRVTLVMKLSENKRTKFADSFRDFSYHKSANFHCHLIKLGNYCHGTADNHLICSLNTIKSSLNNFLISFDGNCERKYFFKRGNNLR